MREQSSYLIINSVATYRVEDERRGRIQHGLARAFEDALDGLAILLGRRLHDKLNLLRVRLVARTRQHSAAEYLVFVQQRVAEILELVELLGLEALVLALVVLRAHHSEGSLCVSTQRAQEGCIRESPRAGT